MSNGIYILNIIIIVIVFVIVVIVNTCTCCCCCCCCWYCFCYYYYWYYYHYYYHYCFILFLNDIFEHPWSDWKKPTVTRILLVSTLILHVQIERLWISPSMGQGGNHCHWMRCDTICSGITEYCCREDSGTGIASCHASAMGYSRILSVYCGYIG